MQLTASVNQYSAWIKWAAVAVIVICLIAVVRLLPVREAVNALEGWLDSLGVWGPLVYGLIYVLATVAFIPGSPLTIGAGAIFGLLWGTVIVSLSSTTGAACAFLIARYLARGKVEKMVQQKRSTQAIDDAIREGGWKIVALLRLSLAIPFNLQNYAYGLTAVRFWPCILASWIAMLPATFLYVYIGYLGRQGIEAAAAGDPSSMNVWKWVLAIVGLIATIAVTLYVTKLASDALKRKGGLDEEPTDGARDGEARSPGSRDAPDPGARPDDQASPWGEGEAADSPRTAGWPWGATIAAGLALVFIAATIWAYANKSIFANLFGPPAVEMQEAYEEKPEGPTFDHSIFEALLAEHVDPDGWVDYAALEEDVEQLDVYIDSIAEADFHALGRDEKLALLINAYNAFTLKLILEHYPGIDSIRDIPSDERWDAVRWQVGSNTCSLNQIEHEQIRPKFQEPRIHFALVCAAVGCPPLRQDAYTGERLEEQLEERARYVHRHDRWFRFEAGNDDAVHLTELYKWYRGDFEQAAGSVLKYVAQYSSQLAAALEAGREPEIRWITYDWALNSIENRGASE